MAKQDKAAKKAARKARRQERQKARKEKKRILKEMMALAGKIKLPDEDQAIDLAKDFKKYWPFMKSGLQFAESLRLTGARADRRLNALIAAGDKVAADPNFAKKIDAFSKDLQGYWKKARTMLIITTRFTGQKVNDTIDKIINVGDQFADYQG